MPSYIQIVSGHPQGNLFAITSDPTRISEATRVAAGEYRDDLEVAHCFIIEGISESTVHFLQQCLAGMKSDASTTTMTAVQVRQCLFAILDIAKQGWEQREIYEAGQE